MATKPTAATATDEELLEAQRILKGSKFAQVNPGALDKSPVTAEVQKRGLDKPKEAMSDDLTGAFNDQLDDLMNISKRNIETQFAKQREGVEASARAQEEALSRDVVEAKKSQKIASEQGVDPFINFLASQGLAESGELVRGEGQRRASLRSVLGGLSQTETSGLADIRLQEQQALIDIDAQMAEALAGLETQFAESKLGAIQAAIDAQSDRDQAQFESDLKIREQEASALSDMELENLRTENDAFLAEVEAQIEDAVANNDLEREKELQRVKSSLAMSEIVLEAEERRKTAAATLANSKELEEFKAGLKEDDGQKLDFNNTFEMAKAFWDKNLGEILSDGTLDNSQSEKVVENFLNGLIDAQKIDQSDALAIVKMLDPNADVSVQ